MTKKDLIRILIKLTGAIILVNTLPIAIGQFVTLFTGRSNLSSIVLLTTISTLSVAIPCLLIFMPDMFIKILKLDKGFDDNQVNIDKIKTDNLIAFGVLIIGGLFILQGFAPLVVEIYYKIKRSIDSGFGLSQIESSDNSRLILRIIELCVGYLLVTNYNRVARFLAKKNKDNSQA